jgi:hypothetical protein
VSFDPAGYSPEGFDAGAGETAHKWGYSTPLRGYLIPLYRRIHRDFKLVSAVKKKAPERYGLVQFSIVRKTTLTFILKGVCFRPVRIEKEIQSASLLDLLNDLLEDDEDYGVFDRWRQETDRDREP